MSIRPTAYCWLAILMSVACFTHCGGSSTSPTEASSSGGSSGTSGASDCANGCAGTNASAGTGGTAGDGGTSGGCQPLCGQRTFALVRTAVWSPDGTKLALVTQEGANKELWLTDVALSTLVRLSDENIHPFNAPVWSPDGKALAFEGTDLRDGYGDPPAQGFPPSQLYVVTPQGCAPPLEVSKEAGHAKTLRSLEPLWSPNSTHLVFKQYVSSEVQPQVTAVKLFTVGATGGAVAAVAQTQGAVNFQPAWVGDGTRLFVRDYKRPYVINRDGSSRSEVPLPAGVSTPPASIDGILSSDGQRAIVLYDLLGNNYSKSVYEVDVSNQTVIPISVPGVPNWFFLGWSNDGARALLLANYGGSGHNFFSFEGGNLSTGWLGNQPVAIDLGDTLSVDASRQKASFSVTSPPGGVNNPSVLTIKTVTSGGQQAIAASRVSGSSAFVRTFWSPDGTKVAIQDSLKGSAVTVVKADGTGSVKVYEATGANTYYSDGVWSPDSSYLLLAPAVEVGGKATLVLAKADGSESSPLTDPLAGSPYLGFFSYLESIGAPWRPDGKKVLVPTTGSDDLPNDVFLYDVATKTKVSLQGPLPQCR